MIGLEHIELVNYRGGYCFIDKRSGTPLSRKEHDAIMESIRPNLWTLGQRDIRQTVLDNPVTEWDWFFDAGEDFSKRNPKEYDFGCVYFGLSSAMPGMYKVGRTTNLVLRSKGHKSKLGKPFRILAYGKTDYHVEHEAALLKFFTDEGYERNGEWFNYYSIMGILSVLDGGSYV